MTRLKVTLRKSPIGKNRNQLEQLKGLGLRRLGHSRTLENTPAVRGMVKKVLHLIDVEERSDHGGLIMANELSNLKPAPGERRPRTRVGRGEGSGKGKTAGKRHQGCSVPRRLHVPPRHSRVVRCRCIGACPRRASRTSVREGLRDGQRRAFERPRGRFDRGHGRVPQGSGHHQPDRQGRGEDPRTWRSRGCPSRSRGQVDSRRRPRRSRLPAELSRTPKRPDGR